MTSYNFSKGDKVYLKVQDMTLEIIGLGTNSERTAPLYFVCPGNSGTLWGMREHEIERLDDRQDALSVPCKNLQAVSQPH